MVPVAGPEGCARGREAVDDAALLEIVGRQFQFDAVTGQNFDAMHAHASRKMTKQLTLFAVRKGDTNSELRIGKGLFHNAGEFDYFLGHREYAGQEPTDPTDGFAHEQAAGKKNSLELRK